MVSGNDILRFLDISEGHGERLIGVALFFAMLYGLSKLPKKKFSFAARVLIGTGAGSVFGLAAWVAGQADTSPAADLQMTVAEDLDLWFQLVAQGYLSLFVCLVLPMVFLASIKLVIHTPAEKQVSPLTRWKKRVNTGMVAVSALIAACLGLVFKVGVLPGTDAEVFRWSVANGEGIIGLIYGRIPSGLGWDLIRANVVGLFVFGLYIGIAARRMSGKYMDTVKPVFNLVDGAFSVGSSVCKTVIAYKPMGAAAIMASLTAEHGWMVLVMLVKMLLVLTLGAGAMLAVQILLCMAGGVGPAAFFKAGKPAMVKALKTRSGAGCLPEAQQALAEGLGLNREVTDLVSSYSITSGMQGCGALFPAMAAVFAMGICGVVMSPGTVLLLVVVISLMSYGITGLPGTATMAEFAAVLGIGLREAVPGLGAMIAVDPIADVPRTLINVTGCMANAVFVERMVRK